jgi:5'-methylthioadenosine phosphorylase
VALASVGSLRGWPVGTTVIPDDFFAPTSFPTYHDDGRGHSVPGFDLPWSEAVAEAWFEVTDTPVTRGGVYAQSRGPRFETAAEVRWLAEHGHIVGMTIADECILAREAGLAYACVATVDNLANGVAGTALTFEGYEQGVHDNRARLVADVRALVTRLASVPRPADGVRRASSSP